MILKLLLESNFFDAKINFKQVHTTCFVLKNVSTLKNTYSPNLLTTGTQGN